MPLRAAEAHEQSRRYDPVDKGEVIRPAGFSERGVSFEHRPVCIEQLHHVGLSPTASNEQPKTADRVRSQHGAVGERQPHRRDSTLTVPAQPRADVQYARSPLSEHIDRWLRWFWPSSGRLS